MFDKLPESAEDNIFIFFGVVILMGMIQIFVLFFVVGELVGRLVYLRIYDRGVVNFTNRAALYGCYWFCQLLML